MQYPGRVSVWPAPWGLLPDLKPRLPLRLQEHHRLRLLHLQPRGRFLRPLPQLSHDKRRRLPNLHFWRRKMSFATLRRAWNLLWDISAQGGC